MFRLLREFRQFRTASKIVAMRLKSGDDEKDLAQLVGMPGYLVVKEIIAGAALTEMATYGNKSQLAPGLAMAVSLFARCEAHQQEMASKVKGKVVEETEDEDDDE
jgi:hypothetical protein